MIIIIRHGEAEHNVKRFFDSSIDSRSHLTDIGVQQITETSHELRKYFDKNFLKVSRIFCSPLLRTVESARIFYNIMRDYELYKDDRFCIDYRLREIEMGDYEGKPIEDYPEGNYNFLSNDKYGGESVSELNRRVASFLGHLNSYNVNVVFTHGETFRRMVYALNKEDVTPWRGQAVVIEGIENKIIFNTRKNEI